MMIEETSPKEGVSMKVLIAPDSFKGNMSAPEVCSAIEEGILRADKTISIYKVPLADGGEGTAKAITESRQGEFIPVKVRGPLGDSVESFIGLINNGKTAVLDMASASGIELISCDRLNPMKTSSYGTGELIRAVLEKNITEMIIGIGGSATNDGGIGMLMALGYRFLDDNGKDVGEGGEALGTISAIDTSGAHPGLKNLSVKIACDVTNPLLGPKGASATFGPQKGASPEMIQILDAGLAKLKTAWIKAGLCNEEDRPGDGAAGGLGAALRYCLNAKMESGAKLVMDGAGFFDKIKDADLVITGEGMTDGQTAGGKLCSVVAEESHKANVPAALLSGALGGDAGKLMESFDYAVSISCGQIGLDAMIKDSKRDLSLAAENLIRAIMVGKKIQ
jgi:glycerate kinase